VPVRRILMGVAVEKAANRAAMANVESLDYFIEYARSATTHSRSVRLQPDRRSQLR
jgi:acetoacetyl-CoA synthetase